MADADILNMSDEDFLKNPPAATVPAADAGDKGAGESASATASEEADDASLGSDEGKTAPVENQEGKTETTQTQEGEGKKPKSSKTAAPNPHQDGESSEEDADEGDGEGDATDESGEGEGEVEETKPDPEAPDYEAFYKQIMTPFKANGRTIELKTPEEAIQLMQMGANYTKKMQELVPHRKVLTMLQNNQLLDEGKLSYLIDLDKKNPEAIKKLIKDAGMDPMEIDTSVEPAYQQGNHRVSDEEVAFSTVLDDMKSTPDGLETLKIVNTDWDQASKDALWKNPQILTIIQGQRENGIYSKITTEVNRQKTLGQIPATVPFLQAYQIIGEQMNKAGAFADIAPKPAPAAAAPAVVGTRVAAPKPTVSNGARAAAVSTSRTTSSKAKDPVVNPLSLSDEDFLTVNGFAGRV